MDFGLLGMGKIKSNGYNENNQSNWKSCVPGLFAKFAECCGIESSPKPSFHDFHNRLDRILIGYPAKSFEKKPTPWIIVG